MDSTIKDILYICLVFLLTLCINIYSLYFLLKIKQSFGNQPLDERSESLLILANISNFIESTLNLIAGAIVYIIKINNFAFEIFFIGLATFSTRFYASCMGLRIYRIKQLYEIRSSNHSLLSNNSNKRIIFTHLLIANAYSLLTTGLNFILYFNYSQRFAESPLIKILYSLESLYFLVFSYKYFNIAKHPSIPIEHIFYSGIWISGITSGGIVRCLYEIPLRNLILLLVSIFSIAHHANSIRPPLPSDIILINIFEIKELFYDFQGYVQLFGSQEENDACRIYKDLAILGEYSPEKVDNIVMINQNTYMSEYVTDSNTINEELYDELKEKLERRLFSIFQKYLQSPEHHSLKKQYFINFN